MGLAVSSSRFAAPAILPALAKTRVWGFEFENTAFPWGWSAVSSTSRWGYWPAYDRIVSDRLDQRYFAGTSGRFLSSDPYEASGGTSEPGSWNRYPYVGGDPVNGNDPTGLAVCKMVEYDTGTRQATMNCTTALLGTMFTETTYYNGPSSGRPVHDFERAFASSGEPRRRDREEAQQALAETIGLTFEAFKSKECSDLFSGLGVLNPTAAMNEMWNRIDVSFGELSLSLIGPPRDAETTAEGLRVGTMPTFPYVGVYYTTAHIRFRPQDWQAWDTRQRLSNFMHEVGHAISFLSVGSITGGFVHADRGIADNRRNDELIQERCVNPVLRRLGL